MYKTHTCGELRAAHLGQTVILAGWVNRQRKHGGITFLDLRDRFGLIQVVTDPVAQPEATQTLESARPEWVLQVKGTIRLRPEGLANPEYAHRRDRGAGAGGESSQPRQDHPLADQQRGRERGRELPPEVPLPGPAPRAHAPQPGAAPPGGQVHPRLPGCARLPGGGNADPVQDHPRGRATIWCRPAFIPASSTLCRSLRSSSSSC